MREFPVIAPGSWEYQALNEELRALEAGYASKRDQEKAAQDKNKAVFGASVLNELIIY